MTEMKDSGERTQFKTGAERQPTTGKGSFDLLPFLAITKLAKVLEVGANKYSRRNYEKGLPLSRYLDSGLRHLVQFTLNFKDEEHLSQAIWNFVILQEMKLRIEAGLLSEELNDIPSEFFNDINGSEIFGELFEPEVKLDKTVVKEAVENAIKTDGEEQFIGDVFGVTKERIAEIEKNALNKVEINPLINDVINSITALQKYKMTSEFIEDFKNDYGIDLNKTIDKGINKNEM